MKLKYRERVSYAVGDAACNLMFSTVTTFLAFFYTDVAGISAIAVGSILLVARVADGVWDLFLGAMVDRTRTRWGQCRPYLIFATPLLAIALVLTFMSPDASPNVKWVYAVGTYTLLMCLYSTVNIPYGALPALMTDDGQERTTLAAWRMFFSSIAGSSVGIFLLQAVAFFGHGNQAAGFSATVTVMAGVAVVLLWACVFGTKERLPQLHQEIDAKLDLATLVRGRAWLIIAGVTLLGSSVGGVVGGVTIYFVKYVFQDESLLAIVTVVLGCSGLAGIAASPLVTRRWCKRNVLIAVNALGIVNSVLFYVIPLEQLWTLCAIAMVGVFFSGVSAPIGWSMIADTADEAELRSGRRMVGMASSGLAFAYKMGSGLGGGALGFLLAYIGYQPNVPQSPETIHGFRLIVTVLPAISGLCTIALLLRYPLTQSRLDEMQTQLQQQRRVAAAAGADVATSARR